MRVQNTSPEFKKMGSLEQTLQENLKLTQETLKEVKKINRHIFWQRVIGWIKFALILIPIILAAIYLPGYIKKAYDIYNEVLSPFAAQTGGTLKNVEGLIEQLQGLPGQLNLDQFKK